MSIRIDKEICNGCNGAKETACNRICPGNLLTVGADGKAMLRDSSACWGCASCVKVCPRQAIGMYLPVELGGRGSILKAKVSPERTVWTLLKPDGSTEVFDIESKKVI